MRLLTCILAAIAAARLAAGDPAQLRREIEQRHHHKPHKRIGLPASAEGPLPGNSTYGPSTSPVATGLPPASRSCTRSTVTVTKMLPPPIAPIWGNTTASSAAEAHVPPPINPSFWNTQSTGEPQAPAATSVAASSTSEDDYSQSASGSSTSSSPAPPSSNPSPTLSGCPTEPFNATAMGPLFGLNMVNKKPVAPGVSPVPFKSASDWDEAFGRIRKSFPQINAVRLYATMDPDSINGADYNHTYLNDSLPAAAKYNLKILAGVWSAGVQEGAGKRFAQELENLEWAIDAHGCDNIAAVAVGNEDLNDVNKWNAADQVKVKGKSDTADVLVREIIDTRALLRRKNCCSVPVTHVDTWNELSNLTGGPWLERLYANVDQAMIANIFPYWGNATVQDSWAQMADQSNRTQAVANQFGKELWLGETGWPLIDKGNNNIHGTDVDHAQDYFDMFGCQIMQGKGTAFYYVDWEEFQTESTSPMFGLFHWDGTPLLDLTCRNSKPDTRAKELPKWLGGDGM